MNKIRCLYLVLGSLVTSLYSTKLLGTERPLIWLTAEEKPIVLKKIETEQWAKERFLALKKRADDFVPTSVDERVENIKRLPLSWQEKTNKFPAFIVQKNVGNNELRNPLQLSLQAAIDCGVMYALIGEDKYAHCAADILYTVVQGLNSTEIGIQPVHLNNRGWIIPKNHLLESRIYAAQIPLIYDFVYNYLKKGGKVYDAHQNKFTVFDFSAAQHVFTTYAQLALDSGLIDNNWPILESSSLVHNALAIDDEHLRQHYLEHYLTLDTAHQDSLAKVAKNYVKAGDIWPESLGYAMHVGYFSLYLMNLIDRIEPSLQLGNKYPNISSALLTYEQLRFPNGDYPAFGDSHRSHQDNYFEYELAYKSAVLNNNKALITKFASRLKQLIKTGQYDRSTLLPRHTSAKPYFAPLALLWPETELGEQKIDTPLNVYNTVHIPFAGLFIQRNLSSDDPVKNSLMATIGGGSYVHGHASGIDMELYGQGHVLGLESGKGAYPTNVHQNYNRLFAGHNTVISNGASASKGGWLQLATNPVEKVVMEPEINANPISDKYSFITARFYDEYNLVKPAYHQRTTAVIRLSDQLGYYLDIFRARSEAENQYHDYLYRNLGDSLDVATDGQTIKFHSDKNRFQPFDPSMIDKWTHDRNFVHPGWHFLKNVNTSSKTAKSLTATFTAHKFLNSPVMMQSTIVAGLELTLSTAIAPKIKSEDPPYNKHEIPMMVLRHEGDAWLNPFVLTFESYQGVEQPAIQSTSRLMHNDVFKGVKVVSKVGISNVTQYILIQENSSQHYENKELGISFIGSFGVITLKNNKLTDLYIGSGTQLSFRDSLLKVESTSSSAYKTY